MMINTTQERYDEWCMYKPCNIQDFFPELTADEREFILTGVTAEEWDKVFGDDEEESE